MLLFIDTDHNPQTGWMGYDFVVNRGPITATTTTIARNLGGKYEWGTARPIKYAVRGNELELAIPRWVLGLNTVPATLDFKWADNIQQTGEWSDFALNGDSTPNDRFN